MRYAILGLLVGLFFAGTLTPVLSRQPYVRDGYVDLDHTKDDLWVLTIKPQKGPKKTLLVPKDCKVDLGDGKQLGRDALKKLTKEKDHIHVELVSGTTDRCGTITKVK